MTRTIKTKIPNRDGLNIAVLVEIPEHTGGGLAFLVHGWKSNHKTAVARMFAEAALANNVIAVRFDCTRSCGESDGPIEQSTVSTFISDLEDVIDWARSQEWFRTPYILEGSSMGGLAIMEHANRHKDEVMAIAPIVTLISGTLSIEARSRHDAAGIEEWQRTGFQEQACSVGRAVFPWSHMEDRLKYNALSYASGLAMPAFICTGSKDVSAPPDQQRLLFDTLGSEDKEFHIIEDAPHIITDPGQMSELKDKLSAWLAKIV